MYDTRYLKTKEKRKLAADSISAYLQQYSSMFSYEKILAKIKLKKKWKFLKNFSIIINTIASNLTFFRSSNILALEDIRLALIIISESLKSDDFF